MHFYVFFCIAIMWQGGYSIGCNCGLGPGVSQCLAGGSFGSIIGGAGSFTSGGGSFISGGGGSIISSSGGSIISGGTSGASYPQIIRPQQLPPVEVGTITRPRVVCKTIGGGVKPLSPIGDLCSGGKTIVKPAVIPKPGCSSCSGSVSSSNSQTIQNSINQFYRAQSGGGLYAVGPDGAPGPHGSRPLGSGTYGTYGAYAVGPDGTYGAYAVGPDGAPGYRSSGDLGSSTHGATSILTGESILTGSSTHSGRDFLSHLNIGHRQCGLPVLPKQDKQSRYAEADAFSLQEYYNLRKKHQAALDESKISEGFSKLPKQVPCASKEKPAAFPEQKLYLLNGDVLVPPTYSETTDETVDEEALRLALEEKEEEQEENIPPSSVHFDDIGYRPYKGTDNQFVDVETSDRGQSPCGSDDLTIDADGLINTDGVEADIVSGPGGTIGLVSSCRDGYKSGQVVIQHAPVSSQVVLPRAPTPACLPGEQQTGSGRFLSYSQSQSLSSSSNNHQSSYQIGCS